MIPRLVRVAAALVLVAAAASGIVGRTAAASTTDGDLIARGAYLTGPAGQCADCHREGFVGGPNPIPAPPGAPWAKVVPALRGLTMFKSDEDAVAFLHAGVTYSGQPPLPPMPHYRFNTADAKAIVAYLRSLK